MRKLSIILTAAIVAVSGMAFTKAVKESKTDLQYWNYNGSTGGTAVENNYSQAFGSDPNCGGSSTVCQIMAEEDPNNLGHPKLDGKDPAQAINQTQFSTTFKD